jgi:hypothetical protein
MDSMEVRTLRVLQGAAMLLPCRGAGAYNRCPPGAGLGGVVMDNSPLRSKHFQSHLFTDFLRYSQ